MPSMLEIQGQLSEALIKWENSDLTDKEREELKAWIESLVVDRSIKVDGVARYIRMQSAEIDALEEEAKYLTQRAKTKKAARDWLKSLYLGIMQRYGIQKVRGNLYTLSIRKSQAIKIDDMALLQKDAPQFVIKKIEYSPNKIAIKEAIKQGNEVPGASLVENESLQVR